jgi:hypothetical protein
MAKLELVSRGAGLWQVGTLLALPGGLRMPIHATIARLADGGLAICSPIGFDDATATAIDALGPVRTLVAPSALHHLFLGEATRRWPAAKVWATPGVRAKRPDVRIEHELGAACPDEWTGALEAVHVGGAPKLSETALFHRPSGAVIATDLVFHVTRPANLATRLILAMTGTGGGRLAQSRVWRFATRDRGATRAAAERILAWPIAQIVVAHGEPYDAPDARAALARAMVRMTGAPLVAEARALPAG